MKPPPFDPKARSTPGGGVDNLRAIPDPETRRVMLSLLERVEQKRRSGAAARADDRLRRDQQDDEQTKLTDLARRAFGGQLGAEAKRAAHRTCMDSAGRKVLDIVRLRALRDQLARIRAKNKGR